MVTADRQVWRTWPRRFTEVSQRLSSDHLVLELDEDERGFGDVEPLASSCCPWL
jgi:hypothetical protein